MGVPYVLNDYELKAFSTGAFFVERKLGERVSGKLYELTPKQIEDTGWYLGEEFESKNMFQGKVAGKDGVTFQLFRRANNGATNSH